MKINALYDAIIKSVSGRLSAYLIQFIFLGVYARLFSPNEFGVLASIQVFALFFQMLSDIGIGPAIINENKINNQQRDGIYSFTFILGIIIGLAFYGFSYGLDYFYSDYSYQNLAIIISLSILFNALSIVPKTSLVKDAKFIHLAKIDVFSELFSFGFVYLFYSMGFGILALASRVLFLAIFRFIMTLFFSKNTELGKPSFNKEVHHIKSIYGFASYQFGFNFINYFSRNLDNILVGKFLGMEKLGIYDKSYQLMRYPLMVTTYAMTPAIQPILTKHRDDKKIIIREHNLLSKRLLILSVLISFFLYLNSRDVVWIIFGNQWDSVVPLIRIFSIIIPIQAILSTSGSFFQVMNKPKLLFFSGLISAVINIAAIIVGVYLGDVRYISYALVISFTLNFIQTYYFMFNFCFEYSAKDFYIGLVRSFSSITPSILIYVVLNIFISNVFDFSHYINFFVNILCALLSLVIFYKFILLSVKK